MKKINTTTAKWIRNASDERAVKNGCRFDVARGRAACDWIEKYAHLYEGELGGQPLTLMKWQRDVVMRIFGWVKFSKERGKELRRFRRASIFLPKKNGKSPLLAAIGLYLLCGDGEQGQKVYASAKDGKQAMIQWQHAAEMVKRSPPLMSECEINLSKARITHIPTSSWMQIVAGDNIASQEGLNGSVMVDETAVVDARLMAVLEYAGISRLEPLQVEFSTAGNNSDGYGKRQWDYGKLVENGDVQDDAFFFCAFAADQRLTDAELEKDLIKIGKAANPSWGTLVFESEFRSSYERAKRSLSDFAAFKMYRLNIWQQSSNPWIRAEDWERCVVRAPYRTLLRPLRKAECYGGLDVSMIHDMTAFALAFPHEDESITLAVKLWMPEATAWRYKDKAPFLEWSKAGFVKLLPGSTIDPSFVVRDICWIGKRVRIYEVGYDRMYADGLMQQVSHGVIAPNGEIFAEGIGCKRVEFLQTYPALSKPTADFEKALIDGKLKIIHNPALTWMSTHVEVKTDANGNRKPEKPEGASYKKIDGIVASIMAVARCQQAILRRQRGRPTISIL